MLILLSSITLAQSKNASDTVIIHNLKVNQLVYEPTFGIGHIKYIETGTKFIDPYIMVKFNRRRLIFFDKYGIYYRGINKYKIQ